MTLTFAAIVAVGAVIACTYIIYETAGSASEASPVARPTTNNQLADRFQLLEKLT